MKTILLAAAIALAAGGVAVAQDTTPPAGSPTTNPDASASQPDMAMPATPDASTAPVPDASAPPMTPDAGAMPASPDASAPPPTSGDMSSGSSMPADSGAMPAPAASTDSYPRCSRTVTDKCNEGAMAGKHMMHRKPHRK